eukprot:TRINITY_DN63449_c0_g1_i1.p1 TRINITY_DN63449_c0_g1~~TRINITY_DN63449_c0_g1_i1.p1  ORF type:complete len:379 (+),score=45.34 TRINITY_DN63449_c0_g1_i1:62-1138(+)
MSAQKLFFGLLAQTAYSQEPAVLSCIAGLPRCIGVPDVATGAEWGCPVVERTDCSGKTSRETCGGCQPPAVIGFACLAGWSRLGNTTSQDGTPVTFSMPVDTSTVKAEHFQWRFADGSTRVAGCALAGGAPASEGNELETIAIVGDAGGWGDFAVGLDIVGDIMLMKPDGSRVSAKGLSYTKGLRDGLEPLDVQEGPILLTAKYQVFSTEGETLKNPLIGAKPYPNHCQHLFRETTHRIVLLFDGGVTLDGLRGITPDRTDLVELHDAEGSVLPAEAVLGLADLGSSIPQTQCEKDMYVHDGDNYVDICLKMSADTPLPATVHLPCDDSTQWSLPKGAKYTCKPQTVKIVIPGEATVV